MKKSKSKIYPRLKGWCKKCKVTKAIVARELCSKCYAHWWYWQHPEHSRKQSNKWKKKHPIKSKRWIQNWRLKTEYGITLMDYKRISYEQGGKCKICGKKPKKLVVDHCHNTGDVRGLLCRPCNTALGVMKDDPKLLHKAISYLKAGSLI